MFQGTLTGHIDSTRFRFIPTSTWEFEVVGWIAHPLKPIRTLSVHLGKCAGRITKTYRQDLVRMLPQLPHAGDSGFVCNFEVASLLGKDQRMVVSAILDSGEQVSSEIPIDLDLVRFEGQVRADSKDIYGTEEARTYFKRRCELEFQAFLLSQDKLSIEQHSTPKVSIIIVTFNQAELTYSCLRSILASEGIHYEVIFVDNASTDRTEQLLRRITGARFIANPRNVHFLTAANQGASVAKGEFLLFLNNDTQVLPNSFVAASAILEKENSIGAVGARIVRPDGILQEAGCYILRDGSTFGFGVSDEPFDDRYSTRRVVDYCSGAFLLTRRSLFERLGGFDKAYAPAYYEDVDYCIRLHKEGFKTVYDPSVTIFHAEKSSSTDRSAAENLTIRNRALIRAKHREYLREKLFPPLVHKSVNGGNRIIVIDNALPDSREGQGFPRGERLLDGILGGGFQVTLFALNQEEPPRTASLASRVTFVPIRNDFELEARLLQHATGARAIVVSRSPNMERFRSIADFVPSISRETKIIFDAEALFANRAILEAKILRGVSLSTPEIDEILKKELELATDSSVVLTVSESEARTFRSHGVKNVIVLSHVAVPREEAPGFNERLGFLMVGPLLNVETPNADGLKWFMNEVFPLLLTRFDGKISFHHAGRFEVEELKTFKGHNFDSLGVVENLSAVYDAHRVFVAPIRFAAGIPIKVIEAAAAGIPVVATSLLAGQLGWKNNEELLVADTPKDFAENCARLYTDSKLWDAITRCARERVRRDFNQEQFRKGLVEILGRL